MKSCYLLAVVMIPVLIGWNDTVLAQTPTNQSVSIRLLDQPVTPITEPPCSYCSTQHAKSLIRDDDRVIAWLRADHNGGAFPIRLFLAGPRVVNDTYGLFFYDPDGGYVAAYEKDYGYQFHGWRAGVMVVKGRDGTLWSALTGKAIEGPRKGDQLTRIPSLVTNWNYWLMLHPESTTYNLFDGKKYASTAMPSEMSQQTRGFLKQQEGRLRIDREVLGVEFANSQRAYPLPVDKARACIQDEVDGEAIALFWYKNTRSATAFSRHVNGRILTFYADKISPESAPFKDRETGTRWSIAGRGIDGPMRGQELTWVNSIQCRWYAWANEYPETTLFEPTKEVE